MVATILAQEYQVHQNDGVTRTTIGTRFTLPIHVNGIIPTFVCQGNADAYRPARPSAGTVFENVEAAALPIDSTRTFCLVDV